MTIDELQRRLKKAESVFNKLSTQKADIEAELYKLQGEYRVLAQLLEDAKKVETTSEAVDPVSTINVEEANNES